MTDLIDLSTQKRIKKLEELVAIQCSHGNWNCNGYMMGMANGMILALHMMRDDKGDPPYLTKPQTWLDDLPPPDLVAVASPVLPKDLENGEKT